MIEDIISKRFYNRKSESFGDYKVLTFIEDRGKTNVPYYLIRFKNTGNQYEVPEKTILSGKVIDSNMKKKETKKKNQIKKKEFKRNKYENKRYVLNLQEKPRLLALDLSTHSSGLSIWFDDKLKDFGYIYQSKDIKFDTCRINYMKNVIIKLIEEHHINVVAIEDIIFKHKIALHVLSKLQGVICDYLYENNIKFLLITPIEWKTSYDINRSFSFGSNSREESKLKTVACVNKDFNLNLEEVYKDSPKDLLEPCYFDVADAIGIGCVALKDRIKY